MNDCLPTSKCERFSRHRMRDIGRRDRQLSDESPQTAHSLRRRFSTPTASGSAIWFANCLVIAPLTLSEHLLLDKNTLLGRFPLARA
jgi:hypothetical protein